MSDQNKERYKKGFNHGYEIAKAGITLPKLDQQKSSTGQKKSEYIKGLKDGTKEFTIEKSRKRGVNKVMSGLKKPAPSRKPPTRGPKR